LTPVKGKCARFALRLVSPARTPSPETQRAGPGGAIPLWSRRSFAQCDAIAKALRGLIHNSAA